MDRVFLITAAKAKYPWLKDDEINFFIDCAPHPDVTGPDVTTARRLGKLVGASFLKNKYPQLGAADLWRIVMTFPPPNVKTDLQLAIASGVGKPYERMFRLAAFIAGGKLADIARISGVRPQTVLSSISALMPSYERSTLRQLLIDQGVVKEAPSLSRLIEMENYYWKWVHKLSPQTVIDPVALARTLIECPTELLDLPDEPELEYALGINDPSIKELMATLSPQQIEQLVAAAQERKSLAEVAEDFADVEGDE